MVPPVTITHPVFFAIGVLVSLAAALRLQKRRASFWLFLIGMLLIATAAGGPLIALHPPGNLVAMIDLSPSTRGAAYRDRASLVRRIHELLGPLPVKLLAFSDHVEPLPAGAALADLPCDHTVYDPPDADAILLFSDGRFALPATNAPTYPAIDPLLIDVQDAAVTDLHFDGNSVIARVRDIGVNRVLSWTNAKEDGPMPVPSGTTLFDGGAATGGLVEARLNPADRWPENDSLELPAQKPSKFERWWIGSGAPPTGWTSLPPADLPADAAEYLSVSAIAVSNMPASELSETQMRRLGQYVRELGGSLFILGGDHAFAAGGYGGTELDFLSPLASDPPAPTVHWMLLADSSGSMAETSNGQSRWSAAVDAVLRLLPLLPPNDIVSVGSFARDLSWWVDGQPVRNSQQLKLPPAEVSPNGPTNLQPALQQIAKRTESSPCELLLLTDADTTIDDPPSLAAALKAAHVRVSLLALGNISPDNPVVKIAVATGGRWIASDDPSRWTDSLKKLMRLNELRHLENTRVQAQFDPSLHLPNRALDQWNHVWLKADAKQLAFSDFRQQPVAIGASWHVGVGTVAAFCFSPSADETATLAAVLAQPPRDPRFKVNWRNGENLTVSIDASNETGYFNGLRFVLSLSDRKNQAIAQTGPGQYQLEIPPLRAPALATVQLDGHVIDRQSLAGRYAPEFNVVGNDDSALLRLAASSGGKVIPPTQRRPINFAWPEQVVRIERYLAAAGAMFLAAALLIWRSGDRT
jgi:hypothetical protein